MKILRYIETIEKDRHSRPAFYFSVKPSWEWFRHWWSFQQRFAQFSAASPATNKTLFILGFRHYQGATRIGPSGATCGSGGSTGTVAWVAVPRVSQQKREAKEEVGRAFRRPWERDLPANGVKHLCDSGPSHLGKWARGQGDAERGGKAWAEGGPVDCEETAEGEVEGVTKQGGVEGWQIPQSRPTAQEVIHI